MADRLTVKQRVEALAELERIADSLNQAAVWLVGNDALAPGELIEQAAEKIAAGLWILESPIRAREPGHMAADTIAAGNGQPQAGTIAAQLSSGRQPPQAGAETAHPGG